jgi:hypothetical protein
MVRFTRRRQYRSKRTRRLSQRLSQRLRKQRRQHGGGIQEDLQLLLNNHADLVAIRAFAAQHGINCIHAQTPVRSADGVFNVILVKEVHGANENAAIPNIVLAISWNAAQNTFGAVEANMWFTSPNTLLDEEEFAAERLADADAKRIAIVKALETVLEVYVCQ